MEALPNELKDLSLSLSRRENPSFVDYFTEGSGAAMLFREHVVSFLTLQDLFVCSRTCKRMKSLCRTYTLRKILKKHSMKDKLSTAMKLDLSKFVIGFVNQEYRNVYNKQGHNGSIIVELESIDVLRRRYHPSTIPDIMFAMTAFFAQRKIPFRNKDVEEYDWEKANSNPVTPVLISATYGKGLQFVDVTMVLRYLLMREGNLRLFLQRPSNGPRYWYNCLFGDPVFKETKELVLTLRLANGRSCRKCYGEDTPINRPLRAESMPTSLD